MASANNQIDGDAVDEHVFQLLKHVISTAHPLVTGDEIAEAILGFLVRASNTWRSLRTLRNYTPDGDGFAVDGGTLLRAMFDAYIQAEFIVHESRKALQRAKDYLDFEHVERFKRERTVTSFDNALSNSMKLSPHRADGQKRLQQEYDRVKERYFVEKRNKDDGSIKRGPGTRNQWHSFNLRKMAELLKKDDEYGILLAHFHGCVHSSSLAVSRGPLVAPDDILDWASTITARIARLNVRHHEMDLSEKNNGIMNALCRPYFDS